jgi:hypothetical protein
MCVLCSLLSIFTIVKYFFCCFFSFWFSMLLKVCLAKQWLALKSCKVANPVSNSSLTYKHQKHWKTCGYFEESSIQPEKMNNFGEMSEMSTLWFGKTSRERRKAGKDYMNPEDGASKASTLTLSPCK